MRRLQRIFLIAIFSALLPAIAFAQTPTTKLPDLKKSPTPTPMRIVKPTSGIDLSLTPVFINLTTDPGKKTESTVKIRNNNPNQTEYLHIRIAKFTSEVGGERPTIVDIGPEDEFARWISFNEDRFALAPLDTKVIKFTVSPPKNSALGYYYALVFERIEENIPENKKDPYVVGAPVLPVLLDVKSPQATRDLSMVDVRTDKIFYEYLPVEFEVKVKNSGNIHVVPDGNIFIDWGSKKDIAILSVNSSKSNILPQTTRVFTVGWNDGMIVREEQRDEQNEFLRDKKGNKVIKTVTHFDKADRFRIGKYTAHVLLIYDNGQRDIPLEASLSFWVFPWKIILLILGIIIGPAVIVYMVMKWSYSRKKNAK